MWGGEYILENVSHCKVQNKLPEKHLEYMLSMQFLVTSLKLEFQEKVIN